MGATCKVLNKGYQIVLNIKWYNRQLQQAMCNFTLAFTNNMNNALYFIGGQILVILYVPIMF